MKQPQHADYHCKHYSYERKGWPEQGGPTCGLGLDLKAPGASKGCWPAPRIDCSAREDWSKAERQKWEDYVAHLLTRTSVALDAVGPVKQGEQRTIDCPHCKGKFTLKRVGFSAFAECTGLECIKDMHFNLGHAEPWPAPNQFKSVETSV